MKKKMKKKEIYDFKSRKIDFEKTEQEIVQSIIDKKLFILKETDNDYFDPRPQNAQQIQQKSELDNKDFIQMVLEFNKVDLAAAEHAKEKKIEDILDAAADLPPNNAIIDDDMKVDDIFIDDDDLFDKNYIKEEDKEFIKDLLKKNKFC